MPRVCILCLLVVSEASDGFAKGGPFSWPPCRPTKRWQAAIIPQLSADGGRQPCFLFLLPARPRGRDVHGEFGGSGWVRLDHVTHCPDSPTKLRRTRQPAPSTVLCILDGLLCVLEPSRPAHPEVIPAPRLLHWCLLCPPNLPRAPLVHQCICLTVSYWVRPNACSQEGTALLRQIPRFLPRSCAFGVPTVPDKFPPRGHALPWNVNPATASSLSSLSPFPHHQRRGGHQTR